jgi:hypothetical protein
MTTPSTASNYAIPQTYFNIEGAANIMLAQKEPAANLLRLRLPNGKFIEVPKDQVNQEWRSANLPVRSEGRIIGRAGLFEVSYQGKFYQGIEDPRTKQLVVLSVDQSKPDPKNTSFTRKVFAYLGVDYDAYQRSNSPPLKIIISPKGSTEFSVSVLRMSDSRYDYYAVDSVNTVGHLEAPLKYPKGTSLEKIRSDLTAKITALHDNPVAIVDVTIASGERMRVPVYKRALDTQDWYSYPSSLSGELYTALQVPKGTKPETLHARFSKEIQSSYENV